MPSPFRPFLDMLRAEMRQAEARPILAATLLLAFVSLAFVALPRVDIFVSGLFYDPATGFLDHRLGLVGFVRETGRLLEWALGLGVLAPLVVKLLMPTTKLILEPRKILFVLLGFALGPGLIVNGVLKDHWGRARPRQILDFGGDASFSPVWWISDQCARNCSFVSGEGASAFWLVALAFIVPRRYVRPVAIVAFAIAVLVSLARIAAGGHFLSDVLLAWLIVFLILLVLRRYVLDGLPPSFDEAVEVAVGYAGRRLRMLFGQRID